MLCLQQKSKFPMEVTAIISSLFISILSPTAVMGAAQEPIYSISPDGKVDSAIYNGYRRYNSECIQCHGPDGEGSTFGPTLVSSLRTLPYAEFRRVVSQGTAGLGTTTRQVMKGFAGNSNVMCHLDDIYVYLKARSEGALGRGRPRKAATPEPSRNPVPPC